MSDLGKQILAKTKESTGKSLDYRTRFSPPLTRQTRRWETLQWSWFLRDHEEPKRTREEGADKAPWFPVWQREVHGRLYTGDRLKSLDTMQPEAQEAARLHACLDDLPDFRGLVKRSARDPYSSGLVTNALSKTVMEHIAPRTADPESLRQLVELLEEDQENGDLKDPGDLDQAREDLANALNESSACANALDDSLVRQGLRAGIAEATEQLNDLDKAGRALGWGAGMGNGGSGGDGKTKAEVAKRLFSSEKLRELMDIAGRMKNIMHDVQATKVRHGVSEITDTEMGGNIDRLLFSELSHLRHPKRKLLLWRRILERGALQYYLEAKEKVGRGPIVVCVDDSGSMGGPREIWAKSIALALLELARKEKRAYAYCTFDTQLVRSVTEVEGKRLDAVALLDSLISHSAGGTNFDAPLEWALDQVEKGDMPDADVVFISDGACSIHNLEQVKARVAKLGCKVIGVGIGGGGVAESLKAFCKPTFSLSDIAINRTGEEGGEEKKVLQTVLGL